nr:MAG TPA: hypothetical protein [Caudoviricetes sp.]
MIIPQLAGASTDSKGCQVVFALLTSSGYLWYTG